MKALLDASRATAPDRPCRQHGGQVPMDPVTWSDVARETGRKAHPSMQWHAIVGSEDYLNFRGSLWLGSPPARGNLAPERLEALCRVLASQMREPAHCFFGLWIGWGWVETGTDVFFLSPIGSPPRPEEHRPSPFSWEELRQRRLDLPHREYVVLTGRLDAATRLGNTGGIGGFDPQSPNLMWPASQEWFVASEIDFDSTLVGGSSELIGAILDTPELDAWPVKPEDSLACDADKINQVPGR
jgi:hypothetical protein